MDRPKHWLAATLHSLQGRECRNRPQPTGTRWFQTNEAAELLDEAIKLKPEERFALVEGLIKSLDEPDKKLDEIWAEEAEKRLKASRAGKLGGVPMEEIFKDE